MTADGLEAEDTVGSASTLGTALMGARVGDTVVVQGPTSTFTVTVLAITG